MGKSRKTTATVLSTENHHFPQHLLSCEERKAHVKSQPAPRLETLLPNRIWVMHHFFTLEECKAWIQYIENDISMELTQQRGNRYYAQRECHRFQKNDSTMAQRLFRRLQHTSLLSVLPQFGGPPIMCNPNLRLYKYTKGMSFGKHIDGSHTVEGLGQTRLTILIYLSSCQGGETSFEHGISFSPQEGAMLLHVHGDDCLEHEGKPVKGGIKYILRTDLVYSS